MLHARFSMEDQFISCDWGTSSFRLRLIAGPDLTCAAQVNRPIGIKAVHQELNGARGSLRDQAFSRVIGAALDELVQEIPTATQCPVLLSGMASSTIGWREVPYTRLPFDLAAGIPNRESLDLRTPEGHPFTVQLFSGLASDTEVMRGEECELLGVAQHARYQPLMEDCLILLPGTHSKHVRVQNYRITEFATAMTGELFEILVHHSILADATGTDGASNPELSDPTNRRAFEAGVERVRDHGLLHSLFQVRTRSVLHQQSQESNRSYLSGLLLAAEFAPLTQQAAKQPILILAGTAFAEMYQAAAAVLGLADRIVLPEEDELAQAAVRGHALLRSRLVHAS